jgi:hypothetical protein
MLAEGKMAVIEFYVDAFEHIAVLEDSIVLREGEFVNIH